MRNILERMKESPLLFDGAMGTMIYERGVFINTCYDEVCLTNPKLISQIHREYVEAGADVIETNTFGANRIMLRPYGLADKAEAINRQAVRLAREAAGDSVYVAAAAGPCLRPDQIMPEEHAAEVESAFAEQIGALAAEGVDLVVFETFTHLRELQVGARTAKRLGLPVLASFVLNERGETAVGTRAETMARTLSADENVDLVGINCGVGPAGVFDALQAVLPVATKPVVVMPNAGYPRDIAGRLIYLTSPEYFTEYAKKYIEMGVRGVGGCCGTTPAHIRMASRAVKSLSGVKKHVKVRAYARQEPLVHVVPTGKKSRLAGKLIAGEKVASVEILPPRSCDMTEMLTKVRRCAEAGVDAINIPDGPRASARISPMIAALTILKEVGIEPILHYCCRDRNLISMQSDLLGGYAAGLANFLIITGDPPKLGDYPDVTGVFDVDAIGLTQVAANLNRGYDIGGNPISPPTGILIGVGANPCAVDPEREIDRYFRKIDAGAEFAITQPVFDIEALLRFLDRVERHPRRIPVIAGIWPLVSYKNAEFMNNEVPGVVVPREILDRMARCRSKEEGHRVGIEIARKIIEEISTRVSGFQVSAPLGNVETALAVLSG
ncbi:MAG: bifunctional homocysteine S-methyltransferase/methylenetetrahydrofolate reductase [Deltaproteobacteria bacterium RBG_16_64_85]|nr:MAG: bifunctional homocysteine S-methyltransferase/methylenetetrahydrofolate reductase [Deltaproteobacteria bacterium RBG_16_64_85]